MSFVDILNLVRWILVVVLDVMLTDAYNLLVVSEVTQLIKPLQNPFFHHRILQLNNFHRLHLMRKFISNHINLS